METRLRLAFAAAGLPEPQLNTVLVGPAGVEHHCPDFQWPAYGLCVEYEGDTHNDDEQVARDIRRARAVKSAGSVEVRLHKADIGNDCASAVRIVREALVERGWRPAACTCGGTPQRACSRGTTWPRATSASTVPSNQRVPAHAPWLRDRRVSVSAGPAHSLTSPPTRGLARGGRLGAFGGVWGLDRCVIGVFSAENPDNATVERSGAGSGSGSGSGAGAGVGSGSGRFRGSYCLLLGSRYGIGPCRWCREWVDLMPTRAQGAWGCGFSCWCGGYLMPLIITPRTK